MSMQDISDKDLDKFFRNSAEEPNIPFDENAWAKMEQSLSRHHQKQRRIRYRNYALLALAVYLFSTVSVRIPEYSIANSSNASITSVDQASAHAKKENQKNEAHTTTQRNEAEETTTDHRIAGLQQSYVHSAGQEHPNKEWTDAADTKKEFDKETKKGKEKERQNDVNKAFNRQSAVRKYNLEEPAAVIKPQKETPHRVSDNNDLTEEGSGSEEQSSVITNSIAYSETDHPANSFVAKDTNTKDHARDNGGTQNNTIENNTGTNNAIALSADSTEKKIPVDSLQPVVKESTEDSTKKKDEVSSRRRFSFGLFASPDYSFTASNQLVSPGLSLGLFAEYHVSRRWTIFAGVMRSSKIYSSNGSDYTATDRYWAYKGYTNRIDGSCAVLDVPLNVKYHFYNRNKNLLFASTGLSSYFMLHEEYRFVYSNPYYADRSWSYDTKRNYFFGIVNLSLGYERYISNYFSIQVEPFIKIPLGAIGDGQVKLTTTGMFFYLKYSIH